MTAAKPTIRLMSPDEFRPVLAAMVGLPVWAAVMKMYELRIGRKHIIPRTPLLPLPVPVTLTAQQKAELVENANKNPWQVADYALYLGNEWQLEKRGRRISRYEEQASAGPLAWLRKAPSIASLCDAQIRVAAVTADASLVLDFQDGQRLTTADNWFLLDNPNQLSYRASNQQLLQAGLEASVYRGDVAAYFRNQAATAAP